MKFKVEICADSVESAINAYTAGADRVELCDNLNEGGTTPSYGKITSARNNLTIGLNVIIRPRGGDFLYSDLEYDVMKRDIEICGERGADGIVLGILRRDGTIDVDRTARLVELAYPMEVTFHRAFDMSGEPFTGLEDVILTGAKRVLTSGLKNRAEEGVELIQQLVARADERIIIMAGSGINISNIAMIARSTGAKEFHLTGRKITDSSMTYRRKDISMGGVAGISEFSLKAADPELIKRIIDILSEV